MAVRRRAGTVARVLRLWRLYGTMDFIYMTRSPRSFLMYTLSDLLLTVAAITAMLLLAERFAGIGPWTRDQVVFLLGYSVTVRGLLDLFFNYNVLFIGRRVGRGQLDHTLVQPQPLWMSLLTEGFAPFTGGATVLPGVGLMLWAGERLGLAVSPGWLALLGVNLAASGMVVFAVAYIMGSLAFWAPRGAEEINTSWMHMVDQLKSMPLDGAGDALLAGLTGVLPLGFVAWHPCRALLGHDRSATGASLTCVAALLLAGVALLAFRLGLKQYGRTGSQRYSGLGHRG